MGAIAGWRAAWDELALDPPDGLLDRLIAAYGEPARAYHTMQHLDECFGHLASVRDCLDEPAAVGLALWFLDAVYDPTRRDNEAASAAWAASALGAGGVAAATVAAVRALILLTAEHAPPPTPDGRHLVDIDLAILGADPDRFDEYERQVGREYAWVDAEAFRRGRAAILAGFVARPRLYLTDHFHNRFEGRARANLARSLADLGG